MTDEITARDLDWTTMRAQLEPYLTAPTGRYPGIKECWPAAQAAHAAGNEQERDRLLGDLGWLVEAAVKARSFRETTEDRL